MNYQTSVEFITNLSGGGITPGLERVRELCRLLGEPQKKLEFIHIAGTNGKGSTSAYLTSILMAAGLKVGRYSSPSITDYRDRFTINNRMITQKDYTDYVARICEQLDICEKNVGSVSAFEAETAIAFLYFADKNCDIVILETGMGGLLDATNIIEKPLASVLCSISWDHMAFLGNTLADIATQKCGIIKENCPVISTKQNDEVTKVITAAAFEKNCSLTMTSDLLATKIKYGLEKQTFNYKNIKKLEIHLPGTFQIDNAVLALTTIETIADSLPVKVTEAAIRKGLDNTVWPARLTVLSKHPMIICDGAHNEDAARRLAESIEMYFTNKRIIYIMGMLRDKEYEKVCQLTAKYASAIITITPPNNKRALHALDLAKTLNGYHSNVTAVDSLEEALEVARLLAERNDVILAFGSLSFQGKFMELVKNGSK